MNDRTRPRLRARHQRESVQPAVLVKRLIITHVVIWVGLAAVFTAPAVTDALRFDPDTFLARPWSIVSYILVHDGFVHITVLMALLALSGPFVAKRLGSRRFLLYYLYCAVGGALAGLILSGLIAVPPTGGTLAPVSGVVLARLWIAADEDTSVAPGSPRYPVWALVGLGAVGLLIAGVVLSEPALALPHAGGLLAGALFWRLWSVGRQRPPAAPLPIRRVVLTRVSAEQEHAREVTGPVAPDVETREPPPDTSPEVIDRLLDKISAEGIESLTSDERISLTEYAKRKRQDEGDL